jgi:ubiquitin C-terminal hydrolase
MNAAIQCGIIGCEDLVEYIESRLGAEDNANRPISQSLVWLIDEIANTENRNTIYPSKIKSAIDSRLARFKGTEQNDCSEFLLELLESIHAELNRAQDRTAPGSAGARSFSMMTRSASSIAAMNGAISGKSISSINWRSKGEQWWSAIRRKDDSIVKDLFEGAIRSVMTCTVCGGISARFETFSQLILPLPLAQSRIELKNLFNELFQSESIDSILCDYCKRKQKFERSIDIWKFPKYLILTLNRFSFETSIVRKNNVCIDYPVDELFSLEDFVAREAPLPESTDYELYAVIEHEGTVNRGHYTAYVKLGDDNQWYYANDARIVKVDKCQIFYKNAYMLFYKSINPR